MFTGKKKNSLITSAIYKIFVEGECEARPCGWRVKGAQRRGHPSLSVSASLTPGHVFFLNFFTGSDVRECVCLGRGTSSMRDPAADVTFLPVKGYNASITHTHVRHTPVLQEMCVSFLRSSLWFPLKAQRRMSSTRVLPDPNSLSLHV